MEEYIIYIAGGYFGDFFHQLSVINEKYLETGKKGVLYVGNLNTSGSYCDFRFGLENTYINTYDLVMKQEYIQDYKIYNNEHYNIDLTIWRKLANGDGWNNAWNYYFSNTYKIEWGKNKWLNVENDDKWKERVVVNEVDYRFSQLNYMKLYSLYREKLIFIAFKDTNYCDYEYFKKKTGIEIEYYNPTSVYEVASIINSCKLFVGGPSGFMSIAHCLHKERIQGLIPDTIPNFHVHNAQVHGLDTYFKSLSFRIKHSRCPIIYISGGRFGDFIHQLSVIKEKYVKTGRKGVLYICERGDSFRFGLESTYNNSYDLIKKQEYIEDYRIHNNEVYDVDLSAWRQCYDGNWHKIFKNWYNVDWGCNAWLTVENDEKWKDRVVINELSYRFSNLDYQKLYLQYGEKLLFISFKETNYSDYETFVEKTGINVEYYNPSGLYEVAVILKSCQLFVGVPSGFIGMALAIKCDIIMGLPPVKAEIPFIEGLENILSQKITFEV